MATTANLCGATTKSGDPCGAFACHGSGFCFWHDPARADDRLEARRRGGQARHSRSLTVAGDPVRIELPGVLRLLERVVGDVLSLENSVARARTIGYLVSVSLKALELADLEARVSRLEEAKR